MMATTVTTNSWLIKGASVTVPIAMMIISKDNIKSVRMAEVTLVFSKAITCSGVTSSSCSVAGSFG